MEKISVILLAGGKGARMQSAVPKQFLSLKEKPIALISFDFFSSRPEVSEIIVVCDPNYRSLFELRDTNKQLYFADPGERRQDSVFNGLTKTSNDSHYVCVHDAARPFVKESFFKSVIEEAKRHGAAAVGMPVKYTVKATDTRQFVQGTLNRELIWEIQTPQVIATPLLKECFTHIIAENLTVTDDVSIVELMQKPVKLVQGCYTNIKITTPEDLSFAHLILEHAHG